MGDEVGSEFVSSGQITAEQLATAQKMQSDTGGDLLRILVKLGFLKDADILESTAKREGLEVAPADGLVMDAEIAAKLPRDLLEKNDLLPIGHTVSHLKLAVADPANLPALEDVRFRSNLEVDLVLASPKDIQRALAAYYNKGAAPASDIHVRRHRHKMDARNMAKQVGSVPAANEALRAISDIDAPAAKMMKALAALLIEKRIISADELKDWVHRLE